MCCETPTPGCDFYNLNIDSGSLWTRRIVHRMITAESGSDTGGVDGISGDVARHRDAPAAGLMQRGL